jgi:hypothetical protein
MVDVKDINPVIPVWPSRPVEDVRHKKDEQRRDRDQGERPRKDDDTGEHQIDEYA